MIHLQHELMGLQLCFEHFFWTSLHSVQWKIVLKWWCKEMKSPCIHCLFDSRYSPQTSSLSVRTLLVNIGQCQSHLYNFGAEALTWTGKKSFFHLSLLGKKCKILIKDVPRFLTLSLHCLTPSLKVNTRLSFRWFSPDRPIANIQSWPNLRIKIFWHPAVHSNQTGLKLDYIWGSIYFNWCIIL